MTLFRFHVHMHDHSPDDIVDVDPHDRDSIQPLVQAGYLLPVYPEREPFPVPARRRPLETE